VTIMRADAILLTPVPTTSKPMQHEATQVAGLTPIDQVRRQVASALFGEVVPLPQVGRFQVEKILGSGGMGVVYAAHDPQLGRKVALKLLQPLTSGDRARERLLREAQAMAQLQHPNVVGVYEAGVHGDQVYVAMEYVENGTLGDWLRVRPRSWQEVVDMLLQAGEGLTAAHAAGLVHRDFKPANILMSAGRARISDFGLARTTSTAEQLERTAEDSSGMLLGAPLTRTGSLLGTPAYMAAEQLRGEPASAASDQFAFGVVLYESLYGHRPFQGESLGALMQAIDTGKIAKPERRVSVPAKVSAVIRRALAQDPARRFPNMMTLLEALRVARRQRWGVQAVAVGLSGAAMVAGMGTLFMFSSPQEEPQATAAAAISCEGDALAGVWDAQRRELLGWAVGEASDPRVFVGLDDYATRWRDVHALRCADDVREPRWTETCLTDRRTALGDLVQAIVDAPGPLRAGTPGAISMLPALSDCTALAKPAVLVSESPLPARGEGWRVRLAISGAFAPHVVAQPPTFFHSGFSPQYLRDLERMPRLGIEMKFAEVIQWLHPETVPEPSWESKLLSPFERANRLRQPRDPLPTVVELGHTAEEAGQDDLAARSWVLAAELLEAGIHSDGARKTVWSGAETALRKLSSDHPVRPQLTRDLAYIQLVHARHTTQAGTCTGVGADFEACSALFSAIKHLKALTGTASARPADHELLARAHEHAGEAVIAAEIRGRNVGFTLDEATLGYLDFGAGEVVPDAPSLADSLHCNADTTVCQVDRGLIPALERDVSVVVGQTRLMPSVKDGVVRGTKIYRLRDDNGMKLLGFRNGDLITAVDGATHDTGVFLHSFQRVLTKGGTLTIDRKGEVMTRKFEVR